MLDEALHCAETRRPCEEARAAGGFERRLPPSRHAHGQHRAEAPRHLRHCDGMSAVLRQPRIEHLLDGRMAREKFR